jgi:hypothetical protein
MKSLTREQLAKMTPNEIMHCHSEGLRKSGIALSGLSDAFRKLSVALQLFAGEKK